MRALWVANLAVWLWAASIGASSYYGIDYHAPAVYFTYQSGGATQYVFAMSAIDNGDIYFHMSGPVVHRWIGVGFGNRMAGSFMIIAYPAHNGYNTTISPRIATGHTEPAFDPNVEIIKVYNDTYAPNANTVTDTGVIIAHAVCKNCSGWASSALDFKNPNQGFIFALGPNSDLADDSPEASIPRHQFYGTFTMDMIQATNYSGWYTRVPAPNVPDFVFPPTDNAFASFGSTPPAYVRELGDPLPGVHAALMCIAFLFIFPAGAIVMQLLRRTLIHAALQTLGLVFVLSGFGVAVKVSRQYNKSRNFNSGHQILGLFIIACLCIQFGLGLLHHAAYVKSRKPTPFGRFHFFFGPLIMILGLVNAGLGFRFAGQWHLNIPYAIIVAVLFLVLFAAVTCQMWCRSRRKYKPDKPEEPVFGNGGDDDSAEYEMSKHPTFGEQPPEAYGPTMPYTPIGPYSAGGPFSPIKQQFSLYEPSTPMTPYTPVDAYMPPTPKTWRKEEITSFAKIPENDYA